MYFFIWEYGEESLKEFINEINSFHLTIKSTATGQKKMLIFQMLKLHLRMVYFQPICLLSLVKHINFLILLLATLIIVKKADLKVKH